MTPKKKPYKPKPPKKQEAKEPASPYREMEITFFNSFEEMNEATYRGYAAMLPEECLAAVTLLRLTRYPYLNIEMDPWGKIIYFE
jgi:hypothetical protein